MGLIVGAYEPWLFLGIGVSMTDWGNGLSISLVVTMVHVPQSAQASKRNSEPQRRG